ncbi:unnamed protein product [Pleuronectes platessa]|uniref:Biogenesis of lysosome-related organelles complex 1 subunit 1 n=1 Tax=Pleuronectes platessa TaxID=8262 RepID=A0A9N7UR35_PLEPL|nr:unnamed protein product [Pleuronectes platessa]
MLSRLLKEHQAKQNERKEQQERRRREAITAATSLTEAMVDHLNVGVSQAYVNQRKLDHEVKTLQCRRASSPNRLLSGSVWWRASIRPLRKLVMWRTGRAVLRLT